MPRKSAHPLSRMEDILPLLKSIANEKQEHVVVLTLDSRRRLIGKHLVFKGTVTSSIMGVREVYAQVLTDYAVSFIISHNHPSGDPEPSEDDLASTQQLEAAGDMLGITLLDHIIVAGSKHYSFLHHGKILPPSLKKLYKINRDDDFDKALIH